MKPRIDRIVYTIYQDQITENTVKFLGKESFIIANYEECIAGYEFNYDEYNEYWFTSLSKAKAKMREYYPNEKIKFKEHKSICSGIRYWEVTE